MQALRPLARSRPEGRTPPEPRLRPVGILGVGSHVPERVLSNEDLERMVETSDEWIRTRTGIRERHVVGEGEATSDLAIAAARRALRRAGLDADEVELIILATATPDRVTPPTVCRVQEALGATRASGFDLNAACSGFATALMTGHRLVGSGAYRNALIVGADALSTITDFTDRESCVLFGDAAGAVVLGDPPDERRILDHVTGLDGTGSEMITVPAGGSRTPASHATIDAHDHFLHIKGREVFRFAVAKTQELVHELLDRNELSLDEIDLLVLHQANRRIIDAAARALSIDPERVYTNIERYGNTSNASIPLALDEAMMEGRLKRGHRVMLVAFGGGLTWAASLVRW